MLDLDKRFEYPSFSGVITFLRSSYIKPEESKNGEYVVVGAPFDTTTGTRPGSRYAPNAIRQESIPFLYHLTAIDKEVIDVVTKQRMTSKMIGEIRDAGDMRVYMSDVMKTTDSISEGVSTITAAGAMPVVLGGDHYITFPSCKGFCEGLEKKLGRKPKVGFIHIDSHLDAYYENETWGKYYHGSPTRRVSELDAVDMHNMAYVGINGTTGIEPYKYVTGNGATIMNTADVNKNGIAKTMKKAVEIAGNGTDTIYVTIDIDVVDQAYSVGTGSYIYGGITAVQLLDMATCLSKEKNIGAIDIVEVSPPLDATGNTARLAAITLINFLKPRLFEYR